MQKIQTIRNIVNQYCDILSFEDRQALIRDLHERETAIEIEGLWKDHPGGIMAKCTAAERKQRAGAVTPTNRTKATKA